MYNPGMPDELLQGFQGIANAMGSRNGTLTQAQLDQYTSRQTLVADPNRDVAEYLLENYPLVASIDNNAGSISLADIRGTSGGLFSRTPPGTGNPQSDVADALFRLRTNPQVSRQVPDMVDDFLSSALPGIYGQGRNNNTPLPGNNNPPPPAGNPGGRGIMGMIFFALLATLLKDR